VRILVTGGTGFLGKYVERELATAKDVKFKPTFLTRKDSSEKNRLKGDLTSWNAGLELAKHKGKFDAILHMAGLYDLRVAREDATLHNIAGTHTALAIAQVCEIPTFIHISTVAVTMPAGAAGRKNDGVAPDSIFSGPFPDYYAETKSNGEKMLRQWDTEFPKRKLILRPGILVGDTEGSAIPRIDGPYHAIDAFRRMRPLLNSWHGFLPLPGQHDVRVPLVPVDFAAAAIRRLSELFLLEGESGPANESYYIADDRGPTIEALYGSALRALGLEHRVQLMPNAPQGLIKPMAEWLARLPREELEYVLNMPKLDTSKTTEKLGADFFPAFESYEPKLWSGYHAFIQNR
jgi:nucleoside-diphosphate-sugar epimerase